MASLANLKTKTGKITCEIFRTKSIVELERKKEREAAVKIHSWFRKIRVQQFIKHKHECATLIQKAFRAFTARKWYRKKLEERIIDLMMLYYDNKATKIQSVWRGYFTRKYKFNFYTRKAYLDALVLKNESIRLELEVIGLNNTIAMKTQQDFKEVESEIMKNRKNHHLLSTSVRPGIYNATHPHKSYLCGVENAIRSTQPFSKEERSTLKQKKLEEHLRTSTGIPKVDVDEYNNNKKKEKHHLTTHSLPPLKNKPQGPFRLPDEVAKQRYKELEPTLRVATDYQSVHKARGKLREEEWTQRIIDKKFLPSTRKENVYLSSLHTSSDFQKPDYGTKHFREPQKEKFVQETAFRRLVSPIPYFDQLGKTY